MLNGALFQKAYVLTITDYHVNNPIGLGKHAIGILNCMGRIMKCDINKRVYLHNGIYSVENKEQREKRLSNY